MNEWTNQGSIKNKTLKGHLLMLWIRTYYWLTLFCDLEVMQWNQNVKNIEIEEEIYLFIHNVILCETPRKLNEKLLEMIRDILVI